MKTVMVTGGSGLVGRFIVDDLQEHGWTVTIAGRTAPTAGDGAPDVGFQPFDLKPSVDFRTLVSGFDALVHAGFSHAAGRYRGGEGNDVRGFWDRNCLASLRLFEAARQSAVERIVFLSSRAVYGRKAPGLVLTEATPCHPDTHYGLVKYACEQHLASLANETGLAGISLRVTGVYGMSGPGDAHKWDGLIRDYLAGRAVAPRVGTEVHGRDVAAAVRIALDAPRGKLADGIFNVSDLLLDRHDILLPVRRHLSCPHRLPERADADAYNAMETSKLRQLGWRPGGRALFDRTMAEILASGSVQSGSS